MRMRIAAVIGLTVILGAARAHAAQEAAVVQAEKGPVRITLRLQKTAVKVKRSLWYTIEMRNIGKEKILLVESVFKSPYGIHVNSRHGIGLYLEVLGPDGEPLRVIMGNYRVKYDWEPPDDQDWMFTESEKKELWTLLEKWKKSGMSEQRQNIAKSDWISQLRKKKDYAELADPAHKHWLSAGASTATYAWSNRPARDYPGRSEDDESLRQGYTELWIYRFLKPGKYRIRAVYNRRHDAETRKLFKKTGKIPAAWVEFKTPFIDFEVLP